MFWVLGQIGYIERAQQKSCIFSGNNITVTSFLHLIIDFTDINKSILTIFDGSCQNCQQHFPRCADGCRSL